MNRFKRFFVAGALLLALGLVSSCIPDRQKEWKLSAAQVQCNLGREFLAENNYNKAMEHFDLAARVEPDKTEAFLLRGVTWLRMKKPDRAMEDFNLVLEREPRHVIATYHRSEAYRALGQPDKAVEDLTYVLDRSPRLVQAWEARGMANMEMGDWEAGLSDMDRALEIKPRSPRLMVYRSRALLSLGRYGECVEGLELALDMDPDSHLVQANLAWILAVCPDNQYRDGRRSADMARDLVEEKPSLDHYNTLAAGLAAAGDYFEAIEAQKKALEVLEASRDMGDPANQALKNKLESRITQYYQGNALILQLREEPEPMGPEEGSGAPRETKILP